MRLRTCSFLPDFSWGMSEFAGSLRNEELRWERLMIHFDELMVCIFLIFAAYHQRWSLATPARHRSGGIGSYLWPTTDTGWKAWINLCTWKIRQWSNCLEKLPSRGKSVSKRSCSSFTRYQGWILMAVFGVVYVIKKQTILMVEWIWGGPFFYRQAWLACWMIILDEVSLQECIYLKLY